MSINFLDKGGFMQRPRYEDEIMKQIGVVLYHLSAGDRKNATNAYDALVTLLYGIPDIDLKEFERSIKKLDDENTKDYNKLYDNYLIECNKAISPDVITPPSKELSLSMIMRKNREILMTLGKNGLTLTSKNLTHM